ncbi:MAG: respiratory nitrate reductase subunit gamma [bacterium]|nr:respiratory nitrate reductase subunit gamma [bacterium]
MSNEVLTTNNSLLYILAFIIFPYISLTLFIFGIIYRFKTNSFSVSSLSSQLLENRVLFFASISWHFAILGTIFTHVTTFLFPSFWANLARTPYHKPLEYIGSIVATLLIIGLLLYMYRRAFISEVTKTTTFGDWIVLLVLMIQVLTGFGQLLFYENGSLFFSEHAVPWLYSLFTFNPNIEYIKDLPLVSKLHFFNAFVFFAILPFTRLIHIIVLPIPYIWRNYVVIKWFKKEEAI